MHKGERRRAGMKARKSKRRFIQAGTMNNQRFYREKLSNKVEKRGILGRLLFLQCEQEKKCGKQRFPISFAEREITACGVEVTDELTARVAQTRRGVVPSLPIRSLPYGGGGPLAVVGASWGHACGGRGSPNRVYKIWGFCVGANNNQSLAPSVASRHRAGVPRREFTNVGGSRYPVGEDTKKRYVSPGAKRDMPAARYKRCAREMQACRRHGKAICRASTAWRVRMN